MSDYTFPNPEHQWDLVDSGSSASDLHPSVLFSIVKRNKAKKPYCQDGFFILDPKKIAHPIQNSYVNINGISTTHSSINLYPIQKINQIVNKWIPSIGLIKNIKIKDQSIDINRIKLTEFYLNKTLSISTGTSKLFLYEVGISQINSISQKNAFIVIGKIINNLSIGTNRPFLYDISMNIVDKVVFDNNPIFNKISDSMTQYTNKPFLYGRTSNSEWCSKIKYDSLKTGFSGCRSENIGFKSLPEQFGTRFITVVSCIQLVFRDDRKSSKATSQQSNIELSLSTNNNHKTEKISFFHPLISRLCVKPGFTQVPNLSYGRINAMINIPVIKTIGRING